MAGAEGADSLRGWPGVCWLTLGSATQANVTLAGI